MDLSDLPEPMRRRIAELDARPALETARDFLGGFLADADGLEEVRQDLQRVAITSTRAHRRYLDALEVLLSEPQPAGTLLHLVEGDGNWALDDNPTDEGAAVVLRELQQMLRAVIDGVERR